MDGAFGFRPPAPAPLSRPLGPAALLRTLARNPLECWTRAHFEEPVVIGGFPFGQVAVVSDPSIVRQVLVESPLDYRKGVLEQRVLSSAGLGDGLVAVDGEQWQRQRRVLASVLGRKTIACLAPVMAEAISAVLGSWRLGGGSPQERVVDIKAGMSRLSLETLVRCMFSDDFGEDHGAWRLALTQFFGASLRIDPFDILGLPEFVPRIVRWRARRLLHTFNMEVDCAIARRCKALNGTKATTTDMLALMLGADDPGTGARMSQAEVKANMLAFFFAGQETTSTVLTWTLYLLTQSLEWYRRVRAEASAVDGPMEEAIDRLVQTRAVVEEAMRLYPPIVGITRSAPAGSRLGADTLERRTMLIVSPYVIHRHRLLWPDPDIFDPNRFLNGAVNRYAYLPFGIGARMCIGASFAMQEIVLAVAMLLKRFSISLAAGQSVWPVHRITLRPRDPLMMVLRPADSDEPTRPSMMDASS